MKQHLRESVPVFAVLIFVAIMGLVLTIFAKASISQEKITLDSHPTQFP